MALLQIMDTQPASPALSAAVDWAEQLLLGTVGTAIAVVAVALVGFAMLQGRVNSRMALRVVLGAFVLFGAPMIAQGITAAVLSVGGVARLPVTPATPPVLPEAPRAPPQFDPYAGASVPM